MGKLIVQQFVSADGFAANSQNKFDAVGGELGNTPEFDLDLIERLKPVSGIVLGRATYDLFAAYWPTPASDDQLVAPALNDLPKHVFSNTIDEAPGVILSVRRCTRAMRSRTCDASRTNCPAT